MKATVRPENTFQEGSLRQVSATKGVTLIVGNLVPGTDPTVRTHADVVQGLEFDGISEDEAKAWMLQNGYKGTLTAPPKKKATAKKGTKKLKKSS